MTYGCHQLLEPARLIVGPVIINSGFRCESVNRKVGGVSNSQHLFGQAADIRPKDPASELKQIVSHYGLENPTKFSAFMERMIDMVDHFKEQSEAN